MSVSVWEKITGQAVREAFENAAEVFCEYCGVQLTTAAGPTSSTRATGDHRIPRSRGGLDVRANIALCCYQCNKRKGMLTEAEFRAVHGNPGALKLLEARVLQQERPEHAPCPDRKRWEELRDERQAARLVGRLVAPDEDCEMCGGRGEWRRRGKVHPCVCRVLSSLERQEVR